MPSDPTRYPGADRSVQLFLLTSQPDDGGIDLIPEVFMGKVQIHILGICPGVLAQERDGVLGVVCSVEHFRPEGIAKIVAAIKFLPLWTRLHHR